MPRTKRLVSSSLAMHVICRGNNRQIIFKDQNDKEDFMPRTKRLVSSSLAMHVIWKNRGRFCFLRKIGDGSVF